MHIAWVERGSSHAWKTMIADVVAYCLDNGSDRDREIYGGDGPQPRRVASNRFRLSWDIKGPDYRTFQRS